MIVRVRYAPSPTGRMHVGNFRAALYNYLFARRHGGVFFVRIEDTDRTRMVEGGVENILRTLAAMGIRNDEGPMLDERGEVIETGSHGPYVQSARLEIYSTHGEKLLNEGKAYRCFCSAERLDAMRKAQEAQKLPTGYDRHCRNLDPKDAAGRAATGEPHVVRFMMPLEGESEVHDLVRGHVTFQNALQEDFVIIKSDNYPTYHLASVIDDHLMATTHVIRGEEWLSSIPKHVQLYKAFDWNHPIFAHLPLLLNPDRTKLSKRQGDVAVEDYLDAGYLPEALLNFVALLGWNPSGEQEMYSLTELVEKFDLAQVNSAGAVFNREKLDWLNGKYFRAMSHAEFAKRARQFLMVAGHDVSHLTDEELGKLLSLEQERVKTFKELPEAVAFLLTEDLEYSKDILAWKKSTPGEALTRLEGVKEFLLELDESQFDRKTLEEKLRAFIVEQEWGTGDTLWPLRVALSGREQSPGPFEILEVLGKMKSLRRIDSAITRLAK